MPRPSRRTFLASASTIAITRPFGSPLHGAEPPVTGAADPNLAPFDKLFHGFLAEHKVPGAGVAVTRNGKLVYARGFGFADAEKKAPVHPDSLFRLASVSKPLTAVGVMLLVERGKVKLNDPVLKHIKLKAAVPAGGQFDKRWEKVTVHQCLQHTGGWDRDKKGGFDPIGVPGRISRALALNGAPTPDDIVRYMMGQPLDFDPGEKMVYSNLGYLVLGRVMEAVTGQGYEPWMRKHVFASVRAHELSLGKGLPEKRPRAEVRYYDAKGRTGACLYPPRAGQSVPLPDGGENIEGFEAHGGWVASPVDLVRFAAALDYGHKSPLLSAESIKEMWARPAGLEPSKKPKDTYYGCGWSVRPVGNTDKASTWHSGLISGSSTLLVRRWDGLNWAVLFNTDATEKGTQPADLIDGPMHAAADAVKKWPAGDLFEKYHSGK
ncbi:serine hydrolase domain-containing protein [Frigoriglobus tundricola]|uniref:Beta-lactamase class C-like and penicillin binding proteins (PBPs) superfamily n=1 Tax=Frigoriglobus tundricola TaxID=2774151 RepID=A0A6M5YVS4_9BACT|nr:serine hydrolase domain-containing protein [Frigoriglobus tundricola]QJW97584.1 Beta-lactamase class C-like and penicillin binding proteins (PBPs) superfamily [Frigoriglobus tundricola]